MKLIFSDLLKNIRYLRNMCCVCICVEYLRELVNKHPLKAYDTVWREGMIYKLQQFRSSLIFAHPVLTY